MNNREFATLIILVVGLLAALFSRDLCRGMSSIIRQLVAPKIAVPLLLLVGTITCSIWGLHAIGLWSPELLAATVLWFIFVGIVWFFRLTEASEDDDFFKKRVLEALGVGAFFEFFLNIQVMPLPFELLLQIALMVLVPINYLARQKEEYKSAAAFTGTLLALIIGGLIAFTGHQLLTHRNDLAFRGLLSELVLPVWLTVTVVPYIYLVALCAGYESLVLRLRWLNGNNLPAAAAIMGTVAGLRGSLVDIGSFRGAPARQAARASSFTVGYRAVRDFKSERTHDQQARAEARQRLVSYTGMKGVGPDGLLLDRREFQATKEALRWLATCQMGWYRNEDRPDTYRPDLLEVLGDLSNHGLPGHHDIQMHVRKDGQAWYAYRSTPSGHIFAIGASKAPPSQWFFDDARPPINYPHASPEWSSVLDPDRPEWTEELQV